MKEILTEWRKYLVEQDTSTEPSFGEQNKPSFKANLIKDFGYVFGTIDGEILAKHNENKLFYGASNNKPFLALFNLIKCSTPKSLEETPCECLRDDELRALLNYDPKDPKTGKKTKKGHKGDSNVVNRALSNRPSDRYKPEQNRYITVRGKQLCKPTGNKEATDFLAKLGFDTNMLVRYGLRQNKQSALGYFKLFSFLAKPEEYLEKLNPDLMKNQNFVNAANHVLRWMRREFSLGQDHEHKGRFLKHLNDLKKMGLSIESLYGKGGYYKNANNSVMIIDNKYIFALFCNVEPNTNKPRSKGGSKNKVMNQMSEIIAKVLDASGKYSIKK
jgi:hypothetical protein